MSQPKPWKRGDRPTASRLNELVRGTTTSASGAGAELDGGSLSFRPQAAGKIRETALLKIIEALDGQDWYSAALYASNMKGVDGSEDLAMPAGAVPMTDGDTADALVVDIGGSGFAADDYVMGILVGVADTGARIYAAVTPGTATYQLSPCDVARDTRYVSYFVDGGGAQIDPPADDQVIEVDGEGCYTVTKLPADAVKCINLTDKCVTVVSTVADCLSGNCAGDCGGTSEATGSSSGQASAQAAIDAAVDQAIGNAESDCGDRGIDIRNCIIATTEDPPGTWAAQAKVCYVCHCDEGYKEVTSYRYSCSSGDLIETEDWTICVEDKPPANKECPA